MSYIEVNCTFISDTQEAQGIGFEQALAKLFGKSTFQTGFLSIIGDLVNEGKDSKEWNNFFNDAKPYTNKVGFIPIRGNNDNYIQNSNFQKYFGMANATNQYYYSFNYSSAQFFVLDMYESSTQTEWLNNTLLNSQEMPFRIFLVHKMQTWIENFLLQYNISYVLSGHYHHYERYTIGNTTILQLGSGGGLMDLTYNPRSTSQFAAIEPCFTQLTINTTTILATTYTLNNEILDQTITTVEAK